MKLGSLFDGSAGFPLAGSRHGITPAWASEIEAFPCAVSRKNFPNMIQLGDITKIDGSKIEPVDVISFGSPCQDMSTAGLRKGLKHEEHGSEETTRSGLFYEAIRIIKEMRNATNGRYPRYAVWENVTGAFSSGEGKDFWAVLNAFVEVAQGEDAVPIPLLPKWPYAGQLIMDSASIAYRTFNAAFWGVPQRRRRIYLVADFAGQRAPEILFEQKSVRGDSEKSEGKREDSAANIGKGSDSADNGRVKPIVYENHPQDSRITECKEGLAPTVVPKYDRQPLVLESSCKPDTKVYGISPYDSNGMKSDNPQSGFYEADTTRTLDANGGNPACSQGGMVVCVDMGAGKSSCGVTEDVAPTLATTRHGAPVVTEPVFASSKNYRMLHVIKDMADTLTATDYKDPPMIYTSSHCNLHTDISLNEVAPTIAATDYKDPNVVYVEPEHIARRLTPTECARLQGFPDDWTDGVEGYTDSKAYKLWGNGIALPCAEFIMKGISNGNNFSN